VHQIDLFASDFFVVFGVFHGLALEIEIFRIDRFFVDDLVELGAEILHPVVAFGAGAVIAKGFDVDDSGDVAGATAVFELADLNVKVLISGDLPKNAWFRRSSVAKREASGPRRDRTTRDDNPADC